MDTFVLLAVMFDVSWWCRKVRVTVAKAMMKGYDCAGKGSAEMNEEGSGGSRRRRKDIQPARMFHANASLRT